ncbi:MAG: hemerythrin domain-containing protein [Bryobacteraceae bacterium]
MISDESRRAWLRHTGSLAGAIAAFSAPLLAQANKKTKEADGDEDVSPAEDLMREHGVLKRVLLIYRNIIDRVDAKQDFPPEVVVSSAKLIRAFVEDYHEKLEEDYLFPRFRKANKLVDLVDVLKAQHQKGRILTDRALQIAGSSSIRDAGGKANLRNNLHQFVRMYEPHEAREDTVLFPAFHKIVSKHEYDALGEEFEKKENQLFHGDGFEKNVDAVARIEKQLGIYDLSQFTPSV